MTSFGIETTRHVRGAVDGNAESLTWLIERFSPLLRLQAEYRLGKTMARRVSPDDVVQDAWLAALPKLGSLVAKGGRLTPVLVTYLSKTVCGRAINHLRAHLTRASREQPLDGGGAATGSSGSAAVAAIIRTSSAQAAASEFGRQLTEALNTLREKEREVIVLRLIEGRTNAEAALELNERPNSVAQRYHRAILLLRERLPASLIEEFAELPA
jgi:RNA polymerase sigma-70 factor (ECF subfamily)